ncbi:DUF1501 domain-containing protein [Geminisphaera colitermitum]|uniref:DUF1501 domain-containing protein n=1 Tax=Geminisphaera colitermitum TaxID=1148786 RepID=UPI0001965069|nr:DUF1501 domain-containing protein [Geminisphaera colitermitum]
MNNPHPILPTTRREFLRYSAQGIGLLAFARFAPSFLVQSTLAQTPAPERDRTILVLVQLAGGNDGLNTVVPYQNDNYYKLRPTISLKKDTLLDLDGSVGLHPSCAAMHEMFKDGKLGVIQNVGYPNPNRSHFRSMEIWETASGSDQSLATGWIGRFLDNACAGAPAPAATAVTERDPEAVHMSAEVPQSFGSQNPHSTFGLSLAGRGGRDNKSSVQLLENLISHSGHDDPGHDHSNGSFLQATMMDALVTEKKVQRVLGAYKAGSTYPGNGFANSLRNVAALIASGFSTRVYFVSLGGFDTHNNQAPQHANLLRNLSEGLAAFQKDLESKGLADQVLTMTFSEFGRRPAENESKGTDHGTAAPLFVMGSKLQGTMHGTAASLDIERRDDLKFSTDFRQIYATVLDRWLACPAKSILGADYEPMAFV